MEDAEKAGLKGKQGPWTNYPKRMLQMRARSWCLRDVYPDVLRGVHVAEEAQDLPEKDVTPAPAAAVVEQPQARSAKPAAIDAEEVKRRPRRRPPRRPAESTEKPATVEVAKPVPGKPMLEGQMRIVKAKLAHAAMTEVDLATRFGPIEELKFEQFEEVQDWIAERGKKIAG
jgi:hypothetical protein